VLHQVESYNYVARWRESVPIMDVSAPLVAVGHTDSEQHEEEVEDEEGGADPVHGLVTC